MQIRKTLFMLVMLLGLCLPVAAKAQEDGAVKRPKVIEKSIAPLGQVTSRPRACTQMWCMEGYTLNLSASAWPHGYYQFKIIADENVYNCEGQLPLPTCGMPAVTCNDKAVQIGESGCALPPDAQSFHALTLSKIPENLVVSITGPTGAVTHESKLEKKCGFPNGEGCDPRPCCSAGESLYIEW